MAKCEYQSKFRREYKCYHSALEEADEDGKKYCIFHSKRKDKDAEKLYLEFRKHYGAREHNFTGFVFPKDFNFKRLRVETGPLNFVDAVFSEAVFLCYVNLSYSKFSGRNETSFYKTQFSNEDGTDFSNAEFSGFSGTSFRGAKFNTKDRTIINFSNARFSGVGETSFCSARFLGGGITDFSDSQFCCECGVDFVGAEFSTKRATNFRGSHFSGKGKTDFRSAKFTGDGSIDFIRTQFSSDGNTFFSGVEFSSEGKTNFNNAEFSGEGRTSFTGTKFKSKKGIGFIGTEFASKGVTDFTNAVFSGNIEVDFSKSYFNAKGNIIFENTDFSTKGLVNFKEARFEEQGAVIFEKAKFSKNTIVDFRKVTTWNLKRFTLDDVYVGRWCFLGTYIRDFDFREVFWKKEKEKYDTGSRSKRNMVFDDFLMSNDMETIIKELNLQEDKIHYEEILKEIKDDLENKHYEVSRLYGQLQIKYDETKRYHESGDFFAGQMEMRKNGNFEKRYLRLILSLYKAISLYGESPIRVFGWVIGLWLLFGLFYIFAGLEPNPNIRNIGYLSSINWDIPKTIPNILFNQSIPAIHIKMIFKLIKYCFVSLFYNFSLSIKYVYPYFAKNFLTYWINDLNSIWSFLKDFGHGLLLSLNNLTLGKTESFYIPICKTTGAVLKAVELIIGAILLPLFILAMNRKFRRTKD